MIPCLPCILRNIRRKKDKPHKSHFSFDADGNITRTKGFKNKFRGPKAREGLVFWKKTCIEGEDWLI